jgi:hypothetical protein
LEGDTDIKRFDRYVDDADCATVNCYGRKNAIEAIELLYEDGFPGAVAIVDADFDRLTGKLTAHEGIIYSEAHDLDLDWTRPNIIGRYLAEVGDKAKCGAHGSVEDIIARILDGLKPVSVTRFLNHQKQIAYKVSDINVSDCFSGFAVDLDFYVDLVTKGRAASDAAKDALKQKIQAALAKSYDLYQLTNGHDFHCALGACLRADLGSRAVPQTWGKEVEAHLRLAFDDADFKALSIFQAIREWIRDNAPIRVLRASLA